VGSEELSVVSCRSSVNAADTALSAQGAAAVSSAITLGLAYNSGQDREEVDMVSRKRTHRAQKNAHGKDTLRFLRSLCSIAAILTTVAAAPVFVPFAAFVFIRPAASRFPSSRKRSQLFPIIPKSSQAIPKCSHSLPN
jgi:hypothetical protein